VPTRPALHLSVRAFLVRGLLAGLLAGLASFAVASVAGEPSVGAAIGVETSHDAGPDDAGHHHDESGALVSRHDQRTWGLLTATLVAGTALGGLVALVAAGAAGRLGGLALGPSTALVALLGWVSVTLVPFLKYPASPPGVGDAGTIGRRTGLFFGFLLVSLVAAAAATVLATRLHPSYGGYVAVVGGTVLFVAITALAAAVMPSVDEVGDFPASVLWDFRRASLLTTGTLWAVLGVALTGLVGRLHRQAASVQARRELAASL
jgi:hypothetical protein